MFRKFRKACEAHQRDLGVSGQPPLTAQAVGLSVDAMFLLAPGLVFEQASCSGDATCGALYDKGQLIHGLRDPTALHGSNVSDALPCHGGLESMAGSQAATTSGPFVMLASFWKKKRDHAPTSKRTVSMLNKACWSNAEMRKEIGEGEACEGNIAQNEDSERVSGEWVSSRWPRTPSYIEVV